MAKQESTGIDTAAAAAEWQAAIAATAGARLNAQLLQQLMTGAALLHRVAQAHPSEDSRVVERWLATFGMSAALAGVALKAAA
ncbi:hypothetical protein [Acidovorax sp. SRB_24]|uniref:hypothetical protein n=1 Tax=Acidovorax sp. SRB_24 TaxID=1962700 RepID=UPI00145F6C1A|nr:hypothetical protein [Acidovorax sp. SRB_24]